MSSSSTGSWFDDEALSLSNQVEEFGEWFQLQPFQFARVNFPPTADPTRQPITFKAVFERDAKDLSLGMEEVKVSTRHLCVTALVCDVPNARQGDRLTHQLTGEVFQLTDVRPDGLSGVEMRMTELGRQK